MVDHPKLKNSENKQWNKNNNNNNKKNISNQ